ncbi:MAG: LuxR C-terminal-related transcriptional regulator [Bacteroidota bacterium]
MNSKILYTYIAYKEADSYKVEKKESYLPYALLGVVCIVGIFFYFLSKKRKYFSPDKTQNRTGLTTQELKITRSVVQGKTNAQIAEEFYLSLSTIKTHINNIYRKLNISSREELKAFYHKKITKV